MRSFLRRMGSTLVLLLILPIALSAGLWGQDLVPVRNYSKAVGAVRAKIENNLGANERPGYAIALVEGDHPVWSGNYGMEDRDKAIPVSDKTIFELGSISKLFTCVAVLQLYEQKKIDLDQPLQTYIPEFNVKSSFPKGKESITIRMLMTHRSGIVTDDDPWETTQPERYFYRAVLEHVKGTNLLFQPGQGWHYSSFGVNLLGVVGTRGHPGCCPGAQSHSCRRWVHHPGPRDPARLPGRECDAEAMHQGFRWMDYHWK